MTALLLTGATGMVGREILARALVDPRFERVLCLVRSSGGTRASDRLAALARSIELPPTACSPEAVEGDVAEPGLGIAGASTLAGVTHVIHCAATVRFDHPLEEARKINTAGTQHVIDVCRGLPGLQRLDAVSTAYVAGGRSDLVREEELEHQGGFHNTYEQTKHESERILRGAMKDLPIAVHRPSIVVGDSRTGKTGAYKVLYWPLKVISRGWLPVIPYDPEGVCDIVPVDYVADGVLALGRDPATLGHTFHLCAGPGRDATIGVLAQRIFTRFHRRPPIRVPPAWFRNVLRPLMMLAPSDRLRRTLESGLVYRPYLELRLRFDTTQADAALGPAGVRCPRVLDYIDTIVDTAVRSDFGRRTEA